MKTKTATKALLFFVISRSLELDQYLSLVGPLQKEFLIMRDDKESARELVDTIIYWETHKDIEPLPSLERLLDEQFVITKI